MYVCVLVVMPKPTPPALLRYLCPISPESQPQPLHNLIPLPPLLSFPSPSPLSARALAARGHDRDDPACHLRLCQATRRPARHGGALRESRTRNKNSAIDERTREEGDVWHDRARWSGGGGSGLICVLCLSWFVEVSVTQECV